MKKLLCQLLVGLVCIQICHAQVKDSTLPGRNINKGKRRDINNNFVLNEPKVNVKKIIDYSGIYLWDDYVQIYPCKYDSTGIAVISNAISTDLKGEFFVQDIVSDDNNDDSDVIIRYLYYVKDKKGSSTISNENLFYRYNYRGDEAEFNSLSAGKRIAREFDGQQKYFLVKLSLFKAHAKKVIKPSIVRASLGFGIINYPFKYRFQKGMKDFSGSFNVGAAISYTLRHDSTAKWNFSGVLGVGISSITLDKASVKSGSDTISSTNGLTALTLSLGFMAQYDKVQIGLFYGWDRISNLNNQTYGWNYQGKPWVSLGLGYSIFTTNSSSQQTKADTQSD